ncbi:tetratricopeptide repeat protein [Nonomuraea fuscirosea]|uniref:tetratricopeptide repeat protein n=1 Tax=Nonomuraea fuscirosea TaxID=1291556 RepID=UPI003420186D
MDRSLATGRFDRCRALANFLSDLRIDRDEDKGRCLYRVARAHLGLGNWAQAEALIDGLPFSSAHAVLVRAEVAFCRGDFDHAENLAHAALALTGEDAREGFLFRLAEIELYRGRFAAGRENATEGMSISTDQAPWQKLLGEIEYFSGNVERANTLISQALQDVAARPVHQRDQALYAGLLQDAALVAEATGTWQSALDSQTEALAIRKASEDARGVAQSLHGLGKARSGLGQIREAAQTLAEAGRMARDLGDGLLAAKVTHSEADVRRADGDHTGAWELTVQALQEFEHHGTPYDVASACLSLAYHGPVVSPDEPLPAGPAVLEDQRQAFAGVVPDTGRTWTALHPGPPHPHSVWTGRRGVRAVKVVIICHRGSPSFATRYRQRDAGGAHADEQALVSEEPSPVAQYALSERYAGAHAAKPHPEGHWSIAHQRHASKLASL